MQKLGAAWTYYAFPTEDNKANPPQQHRPHLVDDSLLNDPCACAPAPGELMCNVVAIERHATGRYAACIRWHLLLTHRHSCRQHS